MRKSKMERWTLNELARNNFSQWPRLFKVGVLVVLFVCITGIGYLGYVQKNIEQYERIKQHGVVLKQTLVLKQQQVRRISEQKERVQQQEFVLNQHVFAWSSENRMPLWLDALAEIGVASHVKLEWLAPQAEITHDFYTEWPVRLVVSGSYAQLIEMLERFTHMAPFFILEEFTLHPQKNQASLLQMSMTLKFYQHLLPIVDETARAEAEPAKLPAIRARVNTLRDPFQLVLSAREASLSTTFKLMGTLTDSRQVWGLVQQPDGVIARVKEGDRLGDWGMVLTVDEQRIVIETKRESSQSDGRRVTLLLAQNDRRTV